jgi:hypothetical protein
MNDLIYLIKLLISIEHRFYKKKKRDFNLIIQVIFVRESNIQGIQPAKLVL